MVGWGLVGSGCGRRTLTQCLVMYCFICPAFAPNQLYILVTQGVRPTRVLSPIPAPPPPRDPSSDPPTEGSSTDPLPGIPLRNPPGGIAPGFPQGSPPRDYPRDRPWDPHRDPLRGGPRNPPMGISPRDLPQGYAQGPPPQRSPRGSPQGCPPPPQGSPACIRQGSLPGVRWGYISQGSPPMDPPEDHPWKSYSSNLQPQRGQMPPRSCAILFCIVATPGGLVSWTVSDKTVGDGGRFSQGTVWWGSVCSGVVERARIW